MSTISCACARADGRESESDRRELERRVRDNGAPARVVERARIVLLAAEKVPGKQIATLVRCAEGTVVTWSGRCAGRSLAGLEDQPRPGKSAQLPEGSSSLTWWIEIGHSA